MASDDPAHRRNQSTNTNSIPLQDLNRLRTSDSDSELPRDGSHRRTLSDRGRALFRSDRNDWRHRQYTAIDDEDSPSPPQSGPAASPRTFVTTPSGQHRAVEDNEAGSSPVADRGAFQTAIGFAGLSYHTQSNSTEQDDAKQDDEARNTMSGPTRRQRNSLPPLRTTSQASNDEWHSVQLEEPTYLSPGVADEDDRQPLTAENSHPTSTLRLPTATGVRFTPVTSPDGRTGSRLGDDLHNAEAGLHTPRSGLSLSPSGRKRSLSPSSAGSPLRRTGTMLRKMSQRVVNLSNEPTEEIVERETRRRASSRPVRPEIPSLVTEEAETGPSGNDGPASIRSPVSEKAPSPVAENVFPPGDLPHIDRNPLRGKSLGIFSPENSLRQFLLSFLVHPFTEPFILLLIIGQTIILAVDSARSVYDTERSTRWGEDWVDYTLFGIFIIYTIEIMLKTIVSGFVLNPVEYSTIDRRIGMRQALAKKANGLFALHRAPSYNKGQNHDASTPKAPPSLLRSFTAQTFDEYPGGSRQAQKKRLAHRAFLRHSFNRLDLVAVVAYWISFSLGVASVENGSKLYVFKMLSCLRILRLLGITSGTSVILRSLKRAAPTLLNVALLIGFFWLLFAIVGVQSFKSSFRRTCVWDGANSADPQQGNYTQEEQFCGGWLNSSGQPEPWLRGDFVTQGAASPKGYICPQGSVCVEGDNPFDGTVSYDNIFQSLELVFVVMSSNSHTDLMYWLADSDYLAAALFFAVAVVFMNLWLINLLIAVITSSFQVIREESRSSAFMAADHDPAEEEPPRLEEDDQPDQRVSGLKKLYLRSKWLWITIIVYGLLVQCMRNATMSDRTADFIDISELIVTLLLLIEICIRFAADWRDFPRHRRNWVDLGLAIITTIIQIPVIRNSGRVYSWLTFFQIVRVYRVVLAVSITRDLITLVLRHVSGVLNLLLFVFLLTFLAAIFGSQLFRGVLSDDEHMNFGNLYNAFLAMYQVLSSEDWTNIVYDVTATTVEYNTAWIGAAFFILWFILGNFIVLSMFIAVIQENFDVSEDQKRLQQVRMFLQQKELGDAGTGTLSLSSVFKFGHAKKQDPLDFGSAATDMLLKDAVVRDFLDEQLGEEAPSTRTPERHNAHSTKPMSEDAGFLTIWYTKIVNKLFHRDPNPFYARLQLTKGSEEIDPRTLAKEVVAATEQRKVIQREYLRNHPNYNVSLFLFRPSNPVRKFCQRIVGPGRGLRIEGVQPFPTVWYTFSAITYAAIIGMVILACVTTPLYQKEYFQRTQFTRRNWFVFSDIGFAAFFTLEAVIKVVADGFFFTPNAYFRGSWGFIDGIVLTTLWASVITSLHDPGGGSRAVGAFKALRALRLLNVSDSARDTFHAVIVRGGWKVVSAAFVSLSLLIPFAIYGLNLFAGQMMSCNDGDSNIFNLTDCTGEYLSQPFEWDVLAPRQVDNEYYDFDNFGGSLFILFQIVSTEGWIDVMWSAESITGVFTQPEDSASRGNAIFFVIFNLLGAVFVLTLFVSVFMRNYTEQTGVAFLTTEQRSWLELRKLLRQVAPSKRPSNKRKRQSWQEWCYRRAITKTGRWQRVMTCLLGVHLVLLCLEYYPEKWEWSRVRDFIFLALTLCHIANIIVRIIGLSWTRFRKSAWDVFSLFAVGGTFITTILLLSNFNDKTYVQLHKLFLVSVVLLLIPRNNQLDQLFKTAAASLTAIGNLLATWFVLFLVYAIALTQAFGLTRFGEELTGNINVRTVPKALILLFRTSLGEGWNELMEDYAAIVPPYCTVGEKYYEGDCGSPQWARALFISWNILSMYIFVYLFTSLIYESFSYVYQRSSGLSIISREEIRRFKQAWAEFDPNGSGYISREAFPRFLGELSGVFEMRIYDGDFTVRALMDDCRVSAAASSTNLPMDGTKDVSDTIDLEKLRERLSELPVVEIRRRRARMNTFYEEVLVSADPDRGIPFNALLMIIAHYKVINDNKSLKLEEFLRRRARLQRVEEAVNRNIVVGFFDTLYWSRRFRRALEAKKSARMTAVPSFGVPEIFVQDDPEESAETQTRGNLPSLNVTPVNYDPIDTPNSLDLGRAWESRSNSIGARSPPVSPRGTRFRNNSIQFSPTASPNGSPRQSRQSSSNRASGPEANMHPEWHFAAALEHANRSSPPGSPGLTSDDAAGRSRANSAISQSEADASFGTSPWGRSMVRSTTQRRPSDRSQ
ncbi:hypothetical protein MBLNU230_g4441t1 [Neophaeotheca triangularis]